MEIKINQWNCRAASSRKQKYTSGRDQKVFIFILFLRQQLLLSVEKHEID